LQKQIKRQIISLNGGFQVIADLNAYHTFISSLKVNSTFFIFLARTALLTRAAQIQSLTSDFANLKMLGHVFIVEDAKDLAQIVRDVTRYGGAYRPEVSRSHVLRLLLTGRAPRPDRTFTSSYSGAATGRRSRKSLIRRCTT
jgi:hypothetical protein